MTVAERFWAKVEKTDDGCWLWRGHKNNRGYGMLSMRPSSPQLAHRISFELAFGAVPAGLLVLHHCDVRACVRPDHLFLGTAADNTADMMAKGRHRSIAQHGEAHGMAKLTLSAVEEIRRALAAGCARTHLADQFGVTRYAIDDIATGRSWRGLGCN